MSTALSTNFANANTTPAISLNKVTLATIEETPALQKPKYDLDSVTASIVHFGPSNFFRAHLAVYCDDLIAKGHTDCGIIAVSPKIQNGTTERRDILKEQDYLYTVVERDGKENKARIIGSIKDVMVGPENPQAVIDLLASPEIKLVTMTVTQNGYYYSKADDSIDLAHPDVKDSLSEIAQPKITVAYIVKALELRKEAGLAPFAIMSCDNMELNSDKLKRTILAYAGQQSRELMHWIADNTSFYNTMVDRIVPGLDESHSDEVTQNYNYKDSWPIFTENFKQFVIESANNKDRLPAFDEVGAKFVTNVAPYEEAKIRLLNGLHMAIGVVGRILGQQYADVALTNDKLREFAKGYMAEAVQTLKPLKDFDYDKYIEQIFDRVDNPYMHDELQRLARNGTEKKDSRFLSTIQDAFNNGTERGHMMFALAAWVKYVSLANPDRTVEQDGPDGLFIVDPRAYETGIYDIASQLNGDIRPILSIEGIFKGLENRAEFVQELNDAYKDVSSTERGVGLAFNDQPVNDENPKCLQPL